MDLIVTVPGRVWMLEQKGPYAWRTGNASVCLTLVGAQWQINQRAGNCAQQLYETWPNRGKGPCVTREPSFDRYGFMVPYLKVEAVPPTAHTPRQ